MLTDDQIRELRDTASARGDERTAVVCRVALGDRTPVYPFTVADARARCAEIALSGAILTAEDMDTSRLLDQIEQLKSEVAEARAQVIALRAEIERLKLPGHVVSAIERYLTTDYGPVPSIGALNTVSYIGEQVAAHYNARKAVAP